MLFPQKYSLALKLLSAKKWQYFLVFLGITLGVMFVFVFFTITQGVKQSFSSSFTDSEQVFTLQSTPSSPELNDELLSKLKQRDDIQSVYKETSLLLPATVKFTLPFFEDFIIDLYFIRGIDDDFFNILSDETEFSDDVIPVLLDPFSLEVLNTFLSNFLGGTTLSPSLFENKEFLATFGKSSYIPAMNAEEFQESKTQVQGFSIFAPLLGVALPYSEVKKLQEDFNQTTNTYSRFYIEPQNTLSRESLMNELRRDGFNAISPKSGLDTLLSIVTILQIILLIASGVIVLLALLFLFSTLTLCLREHTKTIGILRAMGESKKNIIDIFFLQGGLVAISAILSGFISGAGVLYFLSIHWDSFMSTSLFGISIFIPQFLGTLFLILMLIFFTFITIIIPLKNALKKDPLLLLLE